jgi:hypothetical protein
MTWAFDWPLPAFMCGSAKATTITVHITTVYSDTALICPLLLLVFRLICTGLSRGGTKLYSSLQYGIYDYDGSGWKGKADRAAVSMGI